MHDYEVLADSSGSEQRMPAAEFESRVRQAVADDTTLRFAAIRIPDELAKRRGEIVRGDFEFRLREVHLDPIIANATEVTTGVWTSIAPDSDGVVRFFLIVD